MTKDTQYIGPPPGAWRELNPSPEEFFKVDSDGD